MSEPTLLEIRETSAFRRGVRRMTKRGRDQGKLRAVVKLLAERVPLPGVYVDHALTGDRRGFRDCHIEPDWVLIYKVDAGVLVLTLTDTGTHDDLGL